MSEYNYVNQLSYQEIHDVQEDEKLKNKLIKTAKKSLFDQILKDKNNNVLPFDKAYRFRVEFLDGMNIVAKCEEIPIQDVILRVPSQEPKVYPPYWMGENKLGFKDRIKILFKGKI